MKKKLLNLYKNDFENFVKLIKNVYGTDEEGLFAVLQNYYKKEEFYFIIDGRLMSVDTIFEELLNAVNITKILKLLDIID